MILPITSALASLSGFGLLVLSVSVSRRRAMTGIAIGSGADPRLLAKIRAQANFCEYMPLCLGLIGLNEAQGIPAVWICGAAFLLVIGRVVHATSMEMGAISPSQITIAMRAVAMALTWGVVLVASGSLLVTMISCVR